MNVKLCGFYYEYYDYGMSINAHTPYIDHRYQRDRFS